jgi:hypothetical protein
MNADETKDLVGRSDGGLVTPDRANHGAEKVEQQLLQVLSKGSRC